jgi:glycosyltransferase involved in cell wall biosynthesis
MVKVVWLSQYNVFKLLPEIKLNREVILHNSSWIHSLSKELALQTDIELHIITYSHLVSYSQTIKKEGITFHVIKYSFPFTSRGFPWYLPIDKLTSYHSFSKQAQKIIQEIKPHVLHVHGTEGGYNIPAIKTNIPYIISIQGIISEYLKIAPSIGGFLQLFHERAAIRKGKYFGCRTNFDFEFVKSVNKKAVIFDLPEAMNKVFFERQWDPEEEISLLFVGSVIFRKGIEDLIHALYKLKAIFPEIKLKIIGDGYRKYHNHLNQIIEKYNLQSNVLWLGARVPSEIAAELSKSTLFVLPSLMDNSPNCLAEAMAVGVPSIATKVGGIPSMIDDNYDGMLFEKHDIDRLVEIVTMLLGDKNLQKKLSVNARKRAFERNYPPSVTSKYVNVYKSLVK